MGLFDFITSDDFRRDLENDYKEINSCVEIKTWKAACVLAGSIIEAVLIDFLKATDYKDKDILKRSLGQILDICEKERYLSEKTIGLSNAIRNYRNLIHPGRRERLQEEIGEDEAKIAQALIGIIIKEISSQKEKIYGYTAEQIISKIEGDPSSLSIIEHLLDKMHKSELSRLLYKIPERYFGRYFEFGSSIWDETMLNLEKVFRLTFKKSPNAEKKKVAQNFLKMIIEEKKGDKVLLYEEIFFRSSDLEYLPKKDIEIVKKHLFSSIKEQISQDFLKRLGGFGKYIKLEEMDNFIEPILIELINTSNINYQKFLKSYISEEHDIMSEKSQHALEKKVEHWIKYFQNRNKTDIVDRLESLKSWWELPF